MSFLPLSEKIARLKNPSVIGLDPLPEYLPPEIAAKYPDAAEAIFEFNKGIIDAIADIAPAVKPQSAFYERLGVPGAALLKKTIDYAAEAGLYVILDAKRGDIGSTAKAYADAYLVSDGYGKIDCLTVNGYLGSDGVLPFLDAVKANGKAIFMLVKTSNPSSGEFQDKLIGEKPLYRLVGEAAESWGADSVDKDGYSACGAVVGATYPAQLAELRAALPHTFFLIPGYGAQGGGASDVAPGFDKNGGGAVVNSSRGILLAYKKHGGDFRDAARAAAIEMKNDLVSVIR